MMSSDDGTLAISYNSKALVAVVTMMVVIGGPGPPAWFN